MISYPSSEDIPKLKNIWKNIFRDSDKYIDLFFKLKYKNNETLIYKDDGIIKSMLFYPQYDMKIYNDIYKVGYICGTSTLPEYRNRGLMDKLLKEALRLMLKRGDTFSVLIPGEKRLYDFYSRYGYKPFFKRGISRRSFKAMDKKRGEAISLIKTENIDDIIPIYEEVIREQKVVVLQNFNTYKVVMEIYKSYGDLYIIESIPEKRKIGYLFCEYYKMNKSLRVKEIISISDVLEEISKFLY